MRLRLTILLLALVWVGAAWRLARLPALLEQTERAVTLEDAELFTRALAAGVLQPQPDGRLQPLAEDALLAERAARALRSETWGAPEDLQKERLLWNLYHSAPGTAVRGQLRLWNQSRRLAAVRDNSPAAPSVKGEGWRAYECSGQAVAAGTLVPESFGYIHQGQLEPGFGEWTTGSAADSDTASDCVEFRNRFSAPEPKALTVQFIGRSLDRLAVDYVCPPARLQQRAEEGCLASSALCGAGSEKAGSLVLDGKSWTRQPAQGSKGALWEREVRLRFTPASHGEPVVAGLNIRLTEQCQYAWKTFAREEGPRIAQTNTQAYTAHSSDGVPLLNDQGRFTDEAALLGLLPLVGFGRSDYDSISGMLARSRLPVGYDVTLTIDSRIQVAAREALWGGLDRLFAANDRYRRQRQAAVVILDTPTGAILAAAGYPEPPDPRLLTDWDLAAFARVYPLDDPLKVRAWQGVGRLYTPGSTFKTVTALAALAAVRQGDRQTGAFLQGLAPEPFTALTGLALSDARYRPYAGTPLADFAELGISNFDNIPLAAMLYRSAAEGQAYQPLRAGTCVNGTAPVNRTLGLAPAVRDSVNIWFSRLAMLMDGRAALDYDLNYWRNPAQRQPPGLHLAAMMERLAIEKILNLANGAPEGIAGAALASEGGRADLLHGVYPLAWALAQNAIGQGVQVPPLYMAAIAASIATGRQVYPYLFRRWGEATAAYPRGEKLDLDLDLLRAGMKAVPEVGTAEAAFRNSPDRCRTWGKTGTAEIGQSGGRGKEPFKTAWFIGWRDGLDSAEPPLTFACMVSHAYGNRDTGGEVCAPIIADFFERLRAGQKARGERAATLP